MAPLDGDEEPKAHLRIRLGSSTSKEATPSASSPTLSGAPVNRRARAKGQGKRGGKGKTTGVTVPDDSIGLDAANHLTLPASDGVSHSSSDNRTRSNRREDTSSRRRMPPKRYLPSDDEPMAHPLPSKIALASRSRLPVVFQSPTETVPNHAIIDDGSASHSAAPQIPSSESTHTLNIADAAPRGPPDPLISYNWSDIWPPPPGTGFRSVENGGVTPALVRCRNPARGVFYASELSASSEATADLRAGLLPMQPRTGMAAQDLLLAEYQRQTPFRESISVMRFPPDVAALMHRRQRLSEAGYPLGLRIEPTALEDFRVFDICLTLFEGDSNFLHRIREADEMDELKIQDVVTVHHTLDDDPPIEDYLILRGLLLSLPCKLDVFKLLPWDLEDAYKALTCGDLMYVWNPEEEEVDLNGFRPPEVDKASEERLLGNSGTDVTQWYQSMSGLSPGSYNILERKHRKHGIFKREELALAEYDIFDVIHNPRRDLVFLMAGTEWDFLRSVAELRHRHETNRKGEIHSLGSDTIRDIIGPDEAYIFQRPANTNDRVQSRVSPTSPMWEVNGELDSDDIFEGLRFARKTTEDMKRKREIQENENRPEVEAASTSQIDVLEAPVFDLFDFSDK